MDKQLLKLLLKHEFYEQNKSKILKTMFGDSANDIYSTIKDAQEKYKRDLTVEEIKSLYFDNHPALPRAAREAMHHVFADIAEEGNIGPEIVRDIMAKMWLRETARGIGELAIKVINGEAQDLQEIKRVVEQITDDGVPQETVEPVSDDIDVLLDKINNGPHWTLNVESLRQKVPALYPGNLVIIFARPETGKTALTTGFTLGPGGFAEQGAITHFFGNEEPMERTMLRGVSANTSMVFDDIRSDPQRAKTLFEKVRQNVRMYDDVTLSIERLSSHIQKHKPSIFIVDNADKLSVAGDFAREDSKLKALYVRYREIVKRFNCVGIVISQASADAEGLKILSFDMMENSRTGKAAEGDVVIGIGKDPVNAMGEDSYVRYFNFCKNKISGIHGLVTVKLNNVLSRYED